MLPLLLLLPLSSAVEETVHGGDADLSDDEKYVKQLQLFLRQPPYFVLLAIFVMIFVAMWFVADLPPHGTKKAKK